MSSLVRASPPVWRLGATGFISLLGVALFVPTATHLLAFRGPLPGLVVAGVGARRRWRRGSRCGCPRRCGYLLYREDISERHLLRIAGWATLGTVLLGVIVTLIVFAGVALPVYAAATLLAVSTFAHVLIGVRDVQRIRTEELARQREQLAVLNRLVRHNLRHIAQRLLGVEEQLPSAEPDAEAARSDPSTAIEKIATDLTEMNDLLERSHTIIDSDRSEATVLDLTGLIEDVVAEYRETYPEATIETELAGAYHVRGGRELRGALAELVENAIVHTESTPTATISAHAQGGRVIVEIADRGPGIPDNERAVIMREAEIDQLTHSKGLGLWFVRWVMDTYDGEIEIESGRSTGSTIRLALPQAQP